jgi:hypothetical protein
MVLPYTNKKVPRENLSFQNKTFFITEFVHAPRRGKGVYCFTPVRPSFQNIFRHIFLSNYWWQKSDIWSQASHRYAISWEEFLEPSDSYFLFADLVGFRHKNHIFLFSGEVPI